jgi:4,5-DOPA dioxygenase extradiol
LDLFIYVFNNFAFYQTKYTPSGAPQLAMRVKELFMKNGFKHVYEKKKSN